MNSNSRSTLYDLLMISSLLVEAELIQFDRCLIDECISRPSSDREGHSNIIPTRGQKFSVKIKVM